MGCALFLMSKTRSFLCTLLLICVALSFQVANGSFITGNAGNCPSNEFWYEPIHGCIPLGKRSSESILLYGTACPSDGNRYWSSQLSACLPASPVPDVRSSPCPSYYTWDATMSKCIHGSVACGVTEFWFSEKATCLPRRDSTPSSTRCPPGWYWRAQLASCVPANPEALASPTCRGASIWSPSSLVCQRAASPSRRSPSSAPLRPSPSPSARRHDLKSRTASLCPGRLDVCPILKAGDLSDYECVDPQYDLQHCGGCSVDGRGEDCTAIKGAWNVECIRARCSVLTCRAGYVPSADRRICVKL